MSAHGSYILLTLMCCCLTGYHAQNTHGNCVPREPEKQEMGAMNCACLTGYNAAHLKHIDSMCQVGPEVRLIRDLLCGYDSAKRPVKDAASTVHVEMDMAIHQVVNVDVRNQVMKLAVWMRWYWNDEYLVWDPERYGCLDSFYIHPSRIWLPDLTLYNSAKFDGDAWNARYFVFVQKDGRLAWLFPAFLEFACPMDLKKFPFDTQRCDLRFGSWGYDQTDVKITNRYNISDITKFINNSEWTLMDAPMVTREKRYRCCPHAYSIIDIMVTIKRLPLYYIYNLLVPCILITCLNLFTFLLPVESGEKISLTVTSLLTMVVFLLIVSDKMPARSDTFPIISQYFYCLIIIMTCSALVSVCVIHLHFRGTRGAHAPRALEQFVTRHLATWFGYSYVIRNILKHNKRKRARENKEETLARLQNRKRRTSRSSSPCNISRLPRRSHSTDISQCSDEELSSERRDHDSKIDANKPVSEINDNISIISSPDVIPFLSGTPLNYSAPIERRRRKRKHKISERSISSTSMVDSVALPSRDVDDRQFTPDQAWAIISMVLDRIFFLVFLAATICITIYVFAAV